MDEICIDVIWNILKYINPRRLHKLASYKDGQTKMREIVNGMGKRGYMAKWLDYDCEFLHYLKYVYTVTYSNIEYELENYWYFKLTFNLDTYDKLLKIITSQSNNHNRNNNTILLYLNLADQSIQNIDMGILSRVYMLDISRHKNIINMGMLHHTYMLNISHNILSNINMRWLSKVNKLTMQGCAGITDLSELGNVYRLSLESCINLPDTSVLGSVYDLDLSYTTVNDVSMLGNVHTLYLKNVTLWDIKGDELCNIHTLSLDSVEIQYIWNKIIQGACANVYNLTLDVEDIGVISRYMGALGNVNNLYIYSSDPIDSVAILGYVNVYMCP